MDQTVYNTTNNRELVKEPIPIPGIRINEALSNEIRMLNDMHSMLDEILMMIEGPSNSAKDEHNEVYCMSEAAIDICKKTSSALNKLVRIRDML